MKLRLSLPTTIDWWLYLVPLLLTGVGIAIIASLTYGSPRISLAIGQGIYAVIGVLLMIVLTRIDYRNWRGIATYVYGFVILLLIAVDRFGVVIFGARRWLAVAGFQLQPSELAKLAIILVIAKLFVDRDEFRLADYAKLLGIVLLPIGLVLVQPDLGTAMILSIVAFALCLAGPIPKRVIGVVVLVGLLCLPIGWHFLKPYQRSRATSFLHPTSDPRGAGYNVQQALIAVGAGGLFGQGLGQGSQTQNNFLPVAHTDFIFASTAEATGFVGSLVVILLLTFLVYRIIRVAQYAKDAYGFYIGVGCATLFLAQATINIAMNLGLAPVTGIPLPFVSHGGTALITDYITIGILQSIFVRHKKITF